MRGASLRRLGMRPLPMPMRVPVAITLALILALGLCAARSGGPLRDQLDTAAIDALFYGLADANEAQKNAAPPVVHQSVQETASTDYICSFCMPAS